MWFIVLNLCLFVWCSTCSGFYVCCLNLIHVFMIDVECSKSMISSQRSDSTRHPRVQQMRQSQQRLPFDVQKCGTPDWRFAVRPNGTCLRGKPEAVTPSSSGLKFTAGMLYLVYNIILALSFNIFFKYIFLQGQQKVGGNVLGCIETDYRNCVFVKLRFAA